MISKQLMFLNNQQETSTVKLFQRPPLWNFFSPSDRLTPLSFHSAYLANCPEGSSETTREATLKSAYDPIFLDWLIGFTEGDGCFSVSEGRCFFIIQQAEPDVLYGIKDVRGMGSVTYPEPNVWRYAVSAKPDIFKRIHIFNGNRLLMKRREQFKRWLENWNMNMHEYKVPSRALESFPTVSLKTRDRKFDIRSAWFSGFFDAEGCLNLQVQKNRRYTAGYRARLRFIVDQSDAPDFWPQYEAVMGSGHRTVRKSSRCDRWTITDLKVFPKVFLYFSKFPLRSRKRISLLRWYKCYVYRVAKKHLIPVGMQQLLRWKKLSGGTLDDKA